MLPLCLVLYIYSLLIQAEFVVNILKIMQSHSGTVWFYANPCQWLPYQNLKTLTNFS
uniref:Uncharacterized protein n=1 Tax=Arundo donax TaxID=35708 RepID=A0A0A9DP73_ARUDO